MFFINQFHHSFLHSFLPSFLPFFLSFLPFFLSSLLPFFILYSFFLYTASSALVAIGTLLILLSRFRLPLNLPVYFGGFVDVDHTGHKPEVATQWILLFKKQMHIFVFQDCCRICAPQFTWSITGKLLDWTKTSCHKDVEHIRLRPSAMPAFPPTSEGGLETQDGHQSDCQYLRTKFLMESHYYCLEHLADPQLSVQVALSDGVFEPRWPCHISTLNFLIGIARNILG